MKPHLFLFYYLLAIVTVLLATHIVNAGTNGTWTNALANSTWGNSANWENGIVADGSDSIANFSTLDITATRTVNLGSNRTVGMLIFGDATNPSNNWTLANGTGGPWTLALQTTSGTPTIQVINQTTTISAQIGGTQGFLKSGGGSLNITNNLNTFTGGISLSAGTLTFSSGALVGNQVTFVAGATLGWNNGNTEDSSSLIRVEDGVTAVLATGANNITFASPLLLGPVGDASITKTGAGALTIIATNSYTGTTRINGGKILLAGGDNRLSSQTSLVLGQGASGGILQLGDLNAPSNQTISAISTAGSSTVNAIVGGNPVNSTLTINNATASTFGGVLGGSGTNENQISLVKSGAGSLTLTNASNSFVGDVTINGGTVIVTKSSALGSGPKVVTISGATHAPVLRLDGSGGDISLPADITLVTSNDNVNSPAVLSTAGNNVIASGISATTGGFGGGNTRVKVTGGSLTLTGAISPDAGATTSVTVIFDSAAGTSGFSQGTLSDNGAIPLAVTKASAGTWTVAGPNTYSGLTTINAGTLVVDSIAANGTPQPLGTASSAILLGSAGSGGVFEYAGATPATLSRGLTVNGAGGAVVSNTGGALLTLSATQAKGSRALSYIGGQFSVTGRVTGTATSAPLTIDNATVRLSHSNNSYVSPTIVQNSSTLIAANTSASSSATGSGPMSIDVTSTLTGTGFINAGLDNAIVVNGTLSVGDPQSPGAADLRLATSGTGSLTLEATSVVNLDIFSGAGLGDNSGNATTADILRVAGALQIISGSVLKLSNPNGLTSWAEGDIFRLFDWTAFASISGNFAIDASELDLPVGHSVDTTNLYSLGTIAIIVPEPSRTLLLAAGTLVVLLHRKRDS